MTAFPKNKTAEKQNAVLQERMEFIRRNAEEICNQISSGVEQYSAILQMYAGKHTDSPDFLTAFCHFYRVRGVLNRAELIAILRERKPLLIGEVIDRLALPDKRQVHLSFASKILHTINNDLPVYDSLVARFFNLRKVMAGSDYAQRRQLAIETYDRLNEIYSARASNGLLELKPLFEQYFQNMDFISEVKKIDFMIWGWGRIVAAGK